MVMWSLIFLALLIVLIYHRASLIVWVLSLALFFFLLSQLTETSWLTISVCGAVFLALFVLLGITALRQRIIITPVLNLYRKLMPTMSRTEREALSAGTVGWEGDLFSGAPDWRKLLSFSKPALTEEEKQFLSGPVETLCGMIDDWDITQNRADLPPEMWTFLKREGFFALIIPKKYGGKQFSAYAHSQILTRIYGRSVTVGSTVAVPNSLGPAELLLHYGTDEQKKYYLPRLASGEEVPCFALTGPDAGSDAGAMHDTGVVCWGDFEGKKIIGIRLNWNKRYITLAPVATVIGLAFKLYDPDHLLGKKEGLGITCALIPRGTPGITIGRRHFPANAVFQNGPIQGHDVFIPIDWIIGGQKMAGQGWRMLMECLAAGRAISLPASSVGIAKTFAYATGAYARIRRQFNVPIGYFEGIEEALARIGGYVYVMDAARSFTLAAIDQGQQPSVATAIIKYHVTELGRRVANDAMDIHGGKAICLGPKNYMGRFYQSIPIAITVEGANILTRNMIIFGQGVMRCHPYVFAEFEAAKQKDEKQSLMAFDKAFTQHLVFIFSNWVRTIVLSLTSGKVAMVPSLGMKRYFQHAARFSAAFAFMTDISLAVLGGGLKRKESISARLGDIVSYLYLFSSVMKHYSDQGELEDDLPLVDWSAQYCFYQIQQCFDGLLKNFPVRWLGRCLRVFIFPYGKNFSKPDDRLSSKVAELLLSPTPSRDRLSAGVFLTPVANNNLALLADALKKVIQSEPVEKKIKEAARDGVIQGQTIIEQANAAHEKRIITQEQLQIVLSADAARSAVIAVDDFSSKELERS